MLAIKISAPAEIVCAGVSCHVSEAAHPGFEPAAMGVDALNVADPNDNPDASGQIDRFDGRRRFPGPVQSLPCCRRCARRRRRPALVLRDLEEVGPIILLQNRVGSAPSSVTANPHRHLRIGQAALASPAAMGPTKIDGANNMQCCDACHRPWRFFYIRFARAPFVARRPASCLCCVIGPRACLSAH
jgi:hypothetical protein